MSDEVKSLSGESRLNAVLLILELKHGIALPAEVTADAAKDKDALAAAGIAEPKFKSGDKVKFADEEKPELFDVKDDAEFVSGGWFYHLSTEDGQELPGTLAESSLVCAPKPEDAAKDEKVSETAPVDQQPEAEHVDHETV